jgi:hypothetical protein
MLGGVGTAAVPIVFTGQPAHAAGFMEKSFNNFTNNKALDDNIKNMIKLLGAVVYWIPVVVLVGGLFGFTLASKSSNDDAPKTVAMVLMLITVVIGVLWIYDSKLVQQITQKPINPQFAMALLVAA